MNTEGQNFESRESLIDKVVEELAEREGMSAEDILSDIITFAELLEGDESANGYFEELAERMGISLEEMLEYAQRLKER